MTGLGGEAASSWSAIVGAPLVVAVGAGIHAAVAVYLPGIGRAVRVVGSR